MSEIVEEEMVGGEGGVVIRGEGVMKIGWNEVKKQGSNEGKMERRTLTGGS